MYFASRRSFFLLQQLLYRAQVSRGCYTTQTKTSVSLCVLVPLWCPFFNHKGTKTQRNYSKGSNGSSPPFPGEKYCFKPIFPGKD